MAHGSRRLAALLEAHGFMSGGSWLQAWEAAWRQNLNSCDAAGNCSIKLT